MTGKLTVEIDENRVVIFRERAPTPQEAEADPEAESASEVVSVHFYDDGREPFVNTNTDLCDDR